MTSMPVKRAGLTHALLCFAAILRSIVERVRGSSPGSA